MSGAWCWPAPSWTRSGSTGRADHAVVRVHLPIVCHRSTTRPRVRGVETCYATTIRGAGRGRLQSVQGPVTTQEERAEVAAVHVAEPARGVVVVGEEEAGEGAFGRVVAEE